METHSEMIINHLKEINSNNDAISSILNCFNKYAIREANMRNIEDPYLERFLEFETENDFIIAAYTITGFVSLCTFYMEQIDIHTKEICSILKANNLDDETINNLYNNLSGRFYITDSDGELDLINYSRTFLNNHYERFESIYNISKHYAPKGKKYLTIMKSFIFDAYRICCSDEMFNFIEELKHQLKSQPF